MFSLVEVSNAGRLGGGYSGAGGCLLPWLDRSLVRSLVWGSAGVLVLVARCVGLGGGGVAWWGLKAAVLRGLKGWLCRGYDGAAGVGGGGARPGFAWGRVSVYCYYLLLAQG